MSSASLRSPGSRRALIDGVAVVIAAVGICLLHEPPRGEQRPSGQVLPESRRIVTKIELCEIGHDQRRAYAVAQEWLWVDGVRACHVADLAMRIVSNAGAQS